MPEVGHNNWLKKRATTRSFGSGQKAIAAAKLCAQRHWTTRSCIRWTSRGERRAESRQNSAGHPACPENSRQRARTNSQERRTKALSRLNLDLKSLVEDEDFSNAAPHLFGAGFEKRQRSVPKQLPAYERQAALTSRKWESTTLIGFSKNPTPVERRQRER